MVLKKFVIILALVAFFASTGSMAGYGQEATDLVVKIIKVVRPGWKGSYISGNADHRVTNVVVMMGPKVIFKEEITFINGYYYKDGKLAIFNGRPSNFIDRPIDSPSEDSEHVGMSTFSGRIYQFQNNRMEIYCIFRYIGWHEDPSCMAAPLYNNGPKCREIGEDILKQLGTVYEKCFQSAIEVLQIVKNQEWDKLEQLYTSEGDYASDSPQLKAIALMRNTNFDASQFKVDWDSRYFGADGDPGAYVFKTNKVNGVQLIFFIWGMPPFNRVNVFPQGKGFEIFN